MNIFMILETHCQIAFPKKVISIYNATSNIGKCPSHNIPTSIWHHAAFRLQILWNIYIYIYTHTYVSVLRCSVMFDALWSCGMDYSPLGSHVRGILQERILKCIFFYWSAYSSPGNIPDPGIEPRSPALQADFLWSEPPGKPYICMYICIYIICVCFIYIYIYTHIPVYICLCVYIYIYIHQFSSVAQSCPTLCDPMNRSMPGLPVHYQFPEFTQTHVHQIGDAIQPSHPLSSPSSLAPNPSQHQNVFQRVNSSHEVVKVLEFQL